METIRSNTQPTIAPAETIDLAQDQPPVPKPLEVPIAHPDAQALAGLALDEETQAEREKMFRRIGCGC